jgi:hypothetical protein
MTIMICGGSVIQSSFSVEGKPNFEAVIFLPHVEGRRDRGELQHYFRENNRPDSNWTKARIINDPGQSETNYEVLGPGCIIEAVSGHFEVIVPERAGLTHYWRDNHDFLTPWRRTGVFAHGAAESGALIQNPESRHLEVAVRLGRSLYHYWRDDSFVWHRTEPTDHSRGRRDPRSDLELLRQSRSDGTGGKPTRALLARSSCAGFALENRRRGRAVGERTTEFRTRTLWPKRTQKFRGRSSGRRAVGALVARQQRGGSAVAEGPFGDRQ